MVRHVTAPDDPECNARMKSADPPWRRVAAAHLRPDFGFGAQAAVASGLLDRYGTVPATGAGVASAKVVRLALPAGLWSVMPRTSQQ